ncbi:MAG: hypothetical protein RMM58_01245 [Chloroflexota bacterium]|nr:hypothetical protein [Dehalococcoidia bacterium]MDW8252484.1 hypothetical protein [Chloroflexota bacterium]
MATLAVLLARMRQDLNDEVAPYRWSDAHLQRHLERAIREYSLAAPREMKTMLPTTAGSREIAVGTLADLVRVEAVEWPAGQWPPRYVRFSLWQTTLTLLTAATADGSPAAIYWLAVHAVDGSTLPTRDEELVCRGAAGYAALEWANYAIGRVTAGGEETAERYRRWGAMALEEFRQGLDRRRRALRSRRLYLPAGLLPSQSRDAGP